jgi:membrane fusion protein, heavy metal efflux system
MQSQRGWLQLYHTVVKLALDMNNQKPRSGTKLFRSAMVVSIEMTIALLLANPLLVLAHGGHGNEFKGGDTGNTAIAVDAEVANKLGLKVEAAKQQQLDVGVKTTGQIEMLPNQKAEVTSPIKGKIVALLVQPGSVVKQGQPVAKMTSGELSDLRVSSQEKQAEAQASLQQAQVDLKLAQENYQRYSQIADAEISQARSQLAAAQAQYQRDRSLVTSGSVVKVAKANYQRQVQISQSEIEQVKVEVAVAQERYDRDKQLVTSGALSRRTMLDSQAQLAAAKSKLAKANSRPEVLQAETEVRKAEVDLPIRQQQESAGKLAEAQAAVTRALARKDVIAAEAQLRRAQASVAAAQTRLGLSNRSYQTRLQQLGTTADSQGLVTITAPIDGTVSDREASVGQSFQDSGGRLMSIVNDSQVLATANIYEKDLGQVKLGQKVNVRVASLPDRLFTGTISRIGTTVGEGRVVPVQAQLDNAGKMLKPGMFAELEVVTDRTSQPVVAIPSTAVVEANGKQLVFVQSGNSFQAAEVTLGRVTGDLVEIKSGLFAGDRIVTQRGNLLYAQSLRGGSNAASAATDGHGDSPKPASDSQAAIPIWGWLAGAGGGGLVLSATAWWLAKRKRDRGELALQDDRYDGLDLPTEQIDRHNNKRSDEDEINAIITGIIEDDEPKTLPSSNNSVVNIRSK